MIARILFGVAAQEELKSGSETGRGSDGLMARVWRAVFNGDAATITSAVPDRLLHGHTVVLGGIQILSEKRHQEREPGFERIHGYDFLRVRFEPPRTTR